MPAKVVHIIELELPRCEVRKPEEGGGVVQIVNLHFPPGTPSIVCYCNVRRGAVVAAALQPFNLLHFSVLYLFVNAKFSQLPVLLEYSALCALRQHWHITTVTQFVCVNIIVAGF